MSDGGSEQSYSGRLELTWTNKDQRLLAHEDGSYEWLPPSDYRVAEVRLLDNAGTVGETHSDRHRAKDNLLIRGDALNALTTLGQLPEFSRQYVGKVKLAYLDPPFNTGQAFEHYDDALEHSVWLTMMRDRLLQVRRLLSHDGSIWVHCDDAEQARLKVMMDEVFGPDNFVATVIWEKADSPRMDAQLFSSRHDFLLVYRMSSEWKPVPRPMNPDDMAHFDQTTSEGERYRRVLLRKWGANSRRQDRPNLAYSLEAPDGTEVWPIRSDGEAGYWRWSREKYEDNRASIEWLQRKDGSWEPYVMQMARDATSKPPETLWRYEDVGSNRQAKAEIKALIPGQPFDTPKPERLLRRIIEVGSVPGDVVLDCFLGSGTTSAVAHKLGRPWVGIEWSSENLDTFVIPRLSKVVTSDDPGGITEEVGWRGGGGFRMLDVSPSMFAADGGVVVLADWATNGKLAEATAAQLGFEFESDPPFTGRKGRTRLAVIDGLISTDVVELIAGALTDDERAVVCGTAVDPVASKVLRGTRAGSSVRKIPASILDEYRHARWTPRVIAEAIGSGNGSAPSMTARNAPTKAGAAKS
jgi:adenine-specific DNA-methyltransferase